MTWWWPSEAAETCSHHIRNKLENQTVVFWRNSHSLLKFSPCFGRLLQSSFVVYHRLPFLFNTCNISIFISYVFITGLPWMLNTYTLCPWTCNFTNFVCVCVCVCVCVHARARAHNLGCHFSKVLSSVALLPYFVFHLSFIHPEVFKEGCVTSGDSSSTP